MVDIAGTHTAVGSFPDLIRLAATAADLSIRPKRARGEGPDECCTMEARAQQPACATLVVLSRALHDVP
jgi:hypothetical protein